MRAILVGKIVCAAQGWKVFLAVRGVLRASFGQIDPGGVHHLCGVGVNIGSARQLRDIDFYQFRVSGQAIAHVSAVFRPDSPML